MSQTRYPLFINISQIVIGIVAFGYLLYLGQDILLPLVFALFLAILINPLVTRLEKMKWNRVVAITLVVILTFLFICTIVYFIAAQLGNFTDALPQLEEKSNSMVSQAVHWLSDTFQLSEKNINKWIAKLKKENLGDGYALIGQTISTMTGVLVYILLMPVYIFLFLYYKTLLLEFIAKLFPASEHVTVAEVLLQIRKLIQSYLVGLCLEFVLVAVMNSAALLIIGLEYAILIGVIGALLNVIPYIGGVTSAAIPMILAIVTMQPVDGFYVLLAYAFIQFVDNNIIVPKVVASTVSVNALISIIAVFIGGALWGVPGMFLSLPITAMIKVIFDRIDPLKPWGYLIGDTMPSVSSTLFKFGRRKRAAT